MDLCIRAGATARLECAAVGHPSPPIAWQKDGGTDFPAARERRMHVMPEDDVFFIVDVKTEDIGVYSCTAQNTAGTISANATLTVLGEKQQKVTKNSQWINSVYWWITLILVPCHTNLFYCCGLSYRNALLLAAPHRSHRGQRRNRRPPVHSRWQPSPKTKLDQRRQPAGSDRAALLRSCQPAPHHCWRCRGWRGEVHLRDVQPAGHREGYCLAGGHTKSQLRLWSAGWRGSRHGWRGRLRRRWMDHSGNRHHSCGVLCGGHITGLGGHHLPHPATQWGLQRHQHRLVHDGFLELEFYFTKVNKGFPEP